ncbi:MAG: hypothetical protein K2U26_10655 [Cyclobacteriaceae bacterium]|nr:hypothetical protein [Cyclobacteriaceae bacterium]
MKKFDVALIKRVSPTLILVAVSSIFYIYVMQRVAIARALINDPIIVMGDEPTGNFDNKNPETVFGIFQQLAEQYEQTLLIVTHDQSFAQKTHRVITMGRL